MTKLCILRSFITRPLNRGREGGDYSGGGREGPGACFKFGPIVGALIRRGRLFLVGWERAISRITAVIRCNIRIFTRLLLMRSEAHEL